MKIKAHYNGNISITNEKKTNNRHKFNLTDRTKKRVQKLSYSKYRKLAGNSAKLFEVKKNQVLFLTFTIKDNVTLTGITNNAWSYFLKLMRTRHELGNYLWVAEHQKRGAIHYHCLLDMPFIPFIKIKEIFHNSFKLFGIAVSKENSVSASKRHGSIVKNIEQALRYITKYLTKQLKQDTKYKKRFYLKMYNYTDWPKDFIKREFNFKVFAKSKDKSTLSGRIYAFTNEINEKPIEITYEDFIKVSNTTKDIYNFKYCAMYICDLSAVKDLFVAIKQRILTQKQEYHSYFYDKTKEMPTFVAKDSLIDVYQNIVL